MSPLSQRSKVKESHVLRDLSPAFVIAVLMLAISSDVRAALPIGEKDIESFNDSLSGFIKFAKSNAKTEEVMKLLVDEQQRLATALHGVRSGKISPNEFQQESRSRLERISTALSEYRSIADSEMVQSRAETLKVQYLADVLQGHSEPPTSQPVQPEMDWLRWIELAPKLLLSILAAILLWYFLLTRRGRISLHQVVKPFKSIKVFGAEFVLDASVKRSAESTFEAYRKQLKREYDLAVQKTGVRSHLESVIQRRILPHLRAHGLEQTADVRFTIHIEDLLFADTLYQLLDYYPRGGGRGRTWSQRFGMIGKVWRSRKSDVQGAVPKDEEELISKWGMTQEEAVRAGHDRQSFACVVLTDEHGGDVGMLYMDASAPNSFGNRRDLIEVVERGCSDYGVTKALLKLNEDLRGKAPLIRIYDD